MVSDHPPQCFLLLLSILKQANEFSPRLVNFRFYFKSGFLGITLELALFSGQHRRRQWQLTPVLLPGKSHGWRSMVGCSPWGREESNMTKRLHFHFSLFTFMHWRRKWQPTPVFLPGESQGWRSLVGCRPWGRTESDTTEATQQQQQLQWPIYDLSDIFLNALSNVFHPWPKGSVCEGMPSKFRQFMKQSQISLPACAECKKYVDWNS